MQLVQLSTLWAKDKKVRKKKDHTHLYFLWAILLAYLRGKCIIYNIFHSFETDLFEGVISIWKYILHRTEYRTYIGVELGSYYLRWSTMVDTAEEPRTKNIMFFKCIWKYILHRGRIQNLYRSRIRLILSEVVYNGWHRWRTKNKEYHIFQMYLKIYSTQDRIQNPYRSRIRLILSKVVYNGWHRWRTKN